MDDPTQYNVAQAGRSRLPLFIPWHREQKRITSGFNPAAAEGIGEAWKTNAPFSNIPSLSCEIKIETGIARETEANTMSNGNSSEHSSGRLSIAVGNVAIKAGVAASYDKKLQETESSSHASSQGKFRSGRVILAKDPPLTNSAKEMLESKKGSQLFDEHYGSHFVAGYVLGADSGACLGASSSTRMMTETITKQVTVKVLWAEFTTSMTETEAHSSYHMDLDFHSYDTLTETTLSLHANAGEPIDHIQAAARSATEGTKALQERITRKLNELGIRDGGVITVDQCTGLTDAGVVVELILVPFWSLKEYVQCVFKGQMVQGVEEENET